MSAAPEWNIEPDIQAEIFDAYFEVTDTLDQMEEYPKYFMWLDNEWIEIGENEYWMMDLDIDYEEISWDTDLAE